MNSTQTCSHCGEEVSPGARFCARCGSDISGQQGGVATVHVDASAFATMNQAGLLETLRQATLGEYELMGELGRGGMATVYLAHDIALDRKVAIKVMSPQLMSGEGMAERFKREARTAGALSHPHIIPIYAVKESGQLLYFVMKFVEGRPLDSIIKEIGPLPIGMVQTILQQVGSALGYAHRRGVVHRDIKPANIMLDAEGWAVVTDFGIAKVAEKQGLTMTGATMGTPSYMSPEQCAAKELTGASDQYSLGVVAWEMLTGKLPFVAESVMAVMYAHFNEPPPPIQDVRADCPPAIATAIMRMLEKDPASRFPNIEAAVAAIGGAPLAPDDPVRTQMMTLAAAGENLKLMQRFSTPISQTPLGTKAGVTSATGRQSVASIIISPMQVTTSVGAAVQLLATPKARTGATIANKRVTWASTNTDIAKVSASGLVTAIGPGVVTITASTETTSATATITVTAERAGRRKTLYAVLVVLLVVVGAGAYLLGPWSGKRTATGGNPAPMDTSAHLAVAPSAPAPALPAIPPESTPQAGGGGTIGGQRTAQAPAPAVRSRAAARDYASASDARSRAQTAREQAASTGAPTQDLVAGDTEMQAGDQLVAQGQPREAIAHFGDAAVSFSAAATRAQAAAQQAGRPVEPPPTTAPVTPPAAQPVVDPTPQIRTAVQAQLQAISQAFASRDVKQLQAAYPGLTPQQADSWRDFFKNASEVTAVLAPGDVQVNGDKAEVAITEAVNFRDGEGKHSGQSQNLRVHLERQANGAWRVVSIK